jgi:hypothetical protein
MSKEPWFSLWQGWEIFVHCVQVSCGAYAAHSAVGTGSSFLRTQQAWCGADHSPCLVSGLVMSGTIPWLPCMPFWCAQGQLPAFGGWQVSVSAGTLPTLTEMFSSPPPPIPPTNSELTSTKIRGYVLTHTFQLSIHESSYSALYCLSWWQCYDTVNK